MKLEKTFTKSMLAAFEIGQRDFISNDGYANDLTTSNYAK